MTSASNTRQLRCAVLAVGLVALIPAIADAGETLSSIDVEVRTTLNFKVKDEAVAKMLPSGWVLAPANTGVRSGANLWLVLINQTLTQAPDGKARAPHSYAALATLARRTGSENASIMAVGGFASPEIAPGAYGVYDTAKISLERKQFTATDGTSKIEESWHLKTLEGAGSLDIRLQYNRSVSTREKGETKVYSARRPDFYRIYRFEQATDIVKSSASSEDHLTRFSLKAHGAKLEALFDGSEKLVSVVAAPYYSREIYLPEP
jgi:hypothetical protein